MNHKSLNTDQKQICITKSLEKKIANIIEMKEISAREADAVWFMPAMLVNATLPYKEVKGNEYIRHYNKKLSLSMVGRSDIGLPYGKLPRRISAYLTSVAVRTKQRDIFLGKQQDFIKKLGLQDSAGKKGDITRLREQTSRLLSAMFSIYQKGTTPKEGGFRIADYHTISWLDAGASTNQAESYIRLSEIFHENAIHHGVPFDYRAFESLSTTGVDIYQWLTYMMSFLENKEEFTWEELHILFGSGYKRFRDFKEPFKEQMRIILGFYSGANVSEGNSGIVLLPGAPHIPKIYMAAKKIITTT